MKRKSFIDTTYYRTSTNINLREKIIMTETHDSVREWNRAWRKSRNFTSRHAAAWIRIKKKVFYLVFVSEKLFFIFYFFL